MVAPYFSTNRDSSSAKFYSYIIGSIKSKIKKPYFILWDVYIRSVQTTNVIYKDASK